jgi:RNA polymerase sigma-70 factor (ECF subfamily)
VGDIDRVLEAARPRLLRLARARGVPADEVDDAVQESLLIAWRNLAHLRQPERFDAWLDGICGHVCQHHLRQRWGDRAHLTLLGATDGPEGALVVTDDMTDPMGLDLAEELHRQDLQTLLDRALGYLTRSSREALELYYLAELPQREVAERLGLTLAALEARLYRTRMQLRQVLAGELRADAEAFGLALDADEAEGWRETREWCNFCGRHRLRGTFEPLPGGRVNFRLRCPECSPRFGTDIYNTGGAIPLSGRRSFHPAYKRLLGLLKERFAGDHPRTLESGWLRCFGCGHPAQATLLPPGGGIANYPTQYRLVVECDACGGLVTPAAFAAYWGQPATADTALRFVETHPHWMMEPDTRIDVAGRAAIRFRLADVAGSARLTILADAASLRILAMDAG